MSNWLYKKEEIENISQLPSNTYGFIYKITQSYSANYYLFYSSAGPVHKCSLHPYYVILDF